MKRYVHIFFIGIKGVAMSHLARLSLSCGSHVSGADVDAHFITDALLDKITISHSFDPANLPKDCDCVVFSAAHGGEQNPIVIEAKKRGLVVQHQIDFIQEFMQEYAIRVGVAGCHGKTTTTSLLAYALSRLGADPGYLAGVSECAGMEGSAVGEHRYFVVEADEYGMSPPQNKTPKLLRLTLSHAIITNIDFDHPDVYTDLEHTRKTFHTFASNLIAHSPNNTLYACIDDPSTRILISQLHSPQVVGYGIEATAQARISEINSTATGVSFRLDYHSHGDVYTIGLSGEANVRNASGVIAFLLDQGYSPHEIAHAIGGFTGAKRRFEHVATVGAFELYDDYAHHPHEIQATIQAFRMRYPSRRLILIFQPHTYSRTKTFEEDFITSLSQADKALVLPIFGSARESDAAQHISSEQLVTKAHKLLHKNISTLEGGSAFIDALKKHILPGDVICLMGAGDVYTHAKEVITLLKTI